MGENEYRFDDNSISIMFTLKLSDFDTNALNVLSLTYVIGPHLNMNKLATHFTHVNMQYLIKHSCCDNKIVLSHFVSDCT